MFEESSSYDVRTNISVVFFALTKQNTKNINQFMYQNQNQRYIILPIYTLRLTKRLR